MTVQGWALLNKDQVKTLIDLRPELAGQIQKITKSDLNGEVEEARRPLKGKFVLPAAIIDDDEDILVAVTAATGEWHTLVADSDALF
jgi:hypothetical protein